MSKTPFLDFYKKCAESAHIPENGLCNSFGEQACLFELVLPSKEDHPEHWIDGFLGYCAYDGEPFSSHFLKVASECNRRGISNAEARHDFTPLRQTIVLFCAAMNGELDNLK